MNGMRIFAALLATICLIVGFLMAHRYEAEFGGTLFIAGAIIVCGILISSAILELNKTR
jgi:dolichyl-phosphate-mannose--protein O-mannosyl transferase